MSRRRNNPAPAEPASRHRVEEPDGAANIFCQPTPSFQGGACPTSTLSLNSRLPRFRLCSELRAYGLVPRRQPCARCERVLGYPARSPRIRSLGRGRRRVNADAASQLGNRRAAPVEGQLLDRHLAAIDVERLGRGEMRGEFRVEVRDEPPFPVRCHADHRVGGIAAAGEPETQLPPVLRLDRPIGVEDR